MSLRADGVSVRIGSSALLQDVSIEVPTGQLVALAGPNGAGKSTLLAVLAGDRPADTGTVELQDRPLSAWSRAELARRRAVMGGESEVAFAFSAREVALLGRLPLHGGDPDAGDHRIVDELLEAVGATGLAGRVHATLSTGERQRVNLARAMAQVTEAPGTGPSGPHYLLLDEPTSSLDPAHQHAAMRLLRRMAARGDGVLAVVHDLDLAAAYADRIVLLREGRVATSGTPAEVLRPDRLESVFDVPMLVLPHPRRPHLMVVADPPEDR